MAVMNYLVGLWSDMMIQSGKSVTLTRVSLGGFKEIAPQYSGVLPGISNTVGTLATIIGTVGVATPKNPTLGSAWLTLAFGLKSFSHSGFLVNLQEIAPQYSGVLPRISNTARTLAAIIGTL
ncbi:unnamed protein product [Lupinus luteus]|uniref:Uncharacterized protein n=1 Tax=Lupinus luteus TaxID=3873 RepID=A0AAV1WNL5_LUPLU